MDGAVNEVALAGKKTLRPGAPAPPRPPRHVVWIQKHFVSANPPNDFLVIIVFDKFNPQILVG
jgi:hypothetical protein